MSASNRKQKIIFIQSISWVILLPPIAFFFVTVIYSLNTNNISLLGIITIISIVIFFPTYSQYKHKKILLTDSKLYIVNKKNKLLSLSFNGDIREFYINQNKLAALLDYGHVSFIGKNNLVYSVKYISSPGIFCQKFTEAQNKVLREYGMEEMQIWKK